MKRAPKLIMVMFAVIAGCMFNPLLTIADEFPVEIVDLQNQAAEDWFKLIDGGQYEASYTAASSEAKSRMTTSQWESAVSGERESLGKRLTRGLDARSEVTTLTDWPSGEYVILSFSSSFENRASAVEKLTLKKDGDGSWRAAVYSVQ